MSSVVVSPAQVHEREEACGWLLPAVDCGLFTTGEWDAAGLFVARAAAICGAILVQELPGGLGLAWPPRGTSEAVEDSLCRAAIKWLRERGVRACQAFAEPHELAAFAPLRRNGFEHITQLIEMRQVAEVWPQTPSRLHFAPAEEAEARPIVLASQTQTRDFPELNATCPEAEAGGRLFVGSHRGKAVGVVAVDGRTVTYLGLIPEARGQGFATELLRHARDVAGHGLELCVDARNEPALRLYSRHGFLERRRREVFLALWPAS